MKINMFLVIFDFSTQFSAYEPDCKQQMSHKSGDPAIQPNGLACLHSLLNDAHNSASAAQNKAVQRRQQLCLAFQLSAHASLSASSK